MSGRLGRVTRIQHDLQTQPPAVVCAHGDRQIRAEKDLDGSSHPHARSRRYGRAPSATGTPNRVPYGLLVAAFSFGLAAALVVVAVVALRAGAIVSRRWSRPSTALVPVLSASAIAVTGVALAVRGVAQL
jgi:hypothetical protein